MWPRHVDMNPEECAATLRRLGECQGRRGRPAPSFLRAPTGKPSTGDSFRPDSRGLGGLLSVPEAVLCYGFVRFSQNRLFSRGHFCREFSYHGDCIKCPGGFPPVPDSPDLNPDLPPELWEEGYVIREVYLPEDGPILQGRISLPLCPLLL